MHTLATIFATAGFAIYGAPLVLTAFNLVRLRNAEQSPLGTIRIIRSLGPILGVALGMSIFGTLWGVWMDHGTFEWPDTHKGSAALVTFLVMWVSNIKLEIWTLEPLRKLDSNIPEDPPNMSAFIDGVQQYRTHLVLHCSAIIGFAILNWT
jgi:hypothetical protein